MSCRRQCLCSHVIAPNIAVLHRRLSPEQSQASAQALKSIAPDDDFVIAMIKHWWHPAAAAAAARDADQSPSTQGHSQTPLNAAHAGQAQGQQPFEALTAGNPQAAAVGQVAERLLAQRTQRHQQSSRQTPQSVTANLLLNQAEGTLQQRPQGSCHVQSLAGLEVSSHACQDNVQHQGSFGNEIHSADQSNYPMQLTGAEAVEAVPQPKTESTAETVNSGQRAMLVLPLSSIWVLLKYSCHTATDNSDCTSASMSLIRCTVSKCELCYCFDCQAHPVIMCLVAQGR